MGDAEVENLHQSVNRLHRAVNQRYGTEYMEARKVLRKRQRRKQIQAGSNDGKTLAEWIISGRKRNEKRQASSEKSGQDNDANAVETGSKTVGYSHHGRSRSDSDFGSVDISELTGRRSSDNRSLSPQPTFETENKQSTSFKSAAPSGVAPDEPNTRVPPLNVANKPFTGDICDGDSLCPGGRKGERSPSENTSCKSAESGSREKKGQKSHEQNITDGSQSSSQSGSGVNSDQRAKSRVSRQVQHTADKDSGRSSRRDGRTSSANNDVQNSADKDSGRSSRRDGRTSSANNDVQNSADKDSGRSSRRDGRTSSASQDPSGGQSSNSGDHLGAEKSCSKQKNDDDALLNMSLQDVDACLEALNKKLDHDLETMVSGKQKEKPPKVDENFKTKILGDIFQRKIDKFLNEL